MTTGFNWNSFETTIERRIRSLEWILDQAYPTHPQQPKHFIRMLHTNRLIEESECAINENIVTVSGQELRYWFRPYCQPGSQPFDSCRLDGLFGFMRIVIWPRMVKEWSLERLILEPKLDEKSRSMVETYLQLQARAKEMANREIESLLKGKSVHLQVVKAITSLDIASVSAFADKITVETVGIGREDLLSLVDAVNRRDEELIASKRRSFTFRVLYQARMNDRSQDPLIEPLTYGTGEFQRKMSEHSKALTIVAERHFAESFRKFCQCDAVKKIESEVFGQYRSVHSQDFSKRVEELVSTVCH
ncbi:hypothetical protein J0667_00490 [Methylomonas sp. WH-1]|uniref:hypothetical protein n=1 Tax=unclassified Methylomonas TaxID=2608980 RepID=UPI00051B484A|nr:hypothetical protein [Methylomonas sp. LW13]